MKVLLNTNFIFGNNNTDSIVDFSFLTDLEVNVLYDFIENIIKKNRLCGTNKKSSNTCFIPQKNHAIRYNIWHYHINFKKVCAGKCVIESKCLDIKKEKTNFNCAEIVHYLVDNNNNNLIIFAFSRKHTNGDFPLLYNNPLYQRVAFRNQRVEYTELFTFFNYCSENELEPNIDNYNIYLKTLL